MRTQGEVAVGDVTVKNGCVECEECEIATAQLTDLILEARTSPEAKAKLGKIKSILQAALASGVFFLSVVH
jgi:hypothetical protein